MSNFVKLNIQEDGLAFVVLSQSRINALSKEMVSSLIETIISVKSNPNIRAVIISSNQSQFCAGADLKERKDMTPNNVVEIITNIGECFNLIQSIDVPTICAINGVALGGGAEMSLCCDFRVAEESAEIGFTETSLGIIPGAGGTQRLPRLIGMSRAKYWIYSARKFSAEEAFIDGVIDFLSNDGEVLETAIDLAQEIVENAPIALKAAKYAIEFGLQSTFVEGLSVERKAYIKTLDSQDRLEALRAFTEKRSPKWRGK
jgi:enoyl-CoA hydratase/carnithine racemase